MAEPTFNDPKDEYVCTDISLRKIAEKWDMAERVIARRSSAEGWVKARQQFITKRSAKIEDKIATKHAEMVARQARLGQLMQEKSMKGIKSKDPEGMKAKDLTEMGKAGAEIERKAHHLGEDDPGGKTQVNIFLPAVATETPQVDVTPKEGEQNV